MYHFCNHFGSSHFGSSIVNSSIPPLSSAIIYLQTVRAMFCSGCGEKVEKCKCRNRSRDRSEEPDKNVELLSQIRDIVKEENQVVADAMTKRIDAAEKRLDGHEVQIGGCQQGIEDLRKEFKQLRAAPAAGRTGPMLETVAKQAWLGGFPPMEKAALEKKAKALLGTPDGLRSVECHGPVGTGVVVEFDTNENMNTVVSKAPAKLTDPLYIRKNRPPKTPGEKIVSGKVTEAWDKLTKAGVEKEQLRANPRRGVVWVIDKDGVAQVAATVVNEEIEWGQAAPTALRS